MREILFKAKRLDNGEWVEGNIVAVPEDADFMPGAYILPRLVSARADPPTKGRIMLGGFFEVDPATVCQYTNIDIQRISIHAPREGCDSKLYQRAESLLGSICLFAQGEEG